jgi:prepilin-type N-terminal cleavage/methylation domain-containing protein/prepilin-type processing-associated H-X9-DG protein
MKNHFKSCAAFTLTELLVVLAVMALLAATLLPALAATKPKVQKIYCLNNLKQLGVAYRLWEAANNSRYPQAVAASQGGAQNYCTHAGTQPTIAYNPGMVYLVMSNYLITPKLLFCPADNIHAGAATNFSYGDLLSVTTPADGANAPALSAFTKVSYFVGADATEADPQSILAGDCNIGNSGTANNSPATVRFGTTVSGVASAPEITPTAFGFSANNWAWTAGDLHQKTGNLLFADGSVQSATIIGLHLYMQNATNTVNSPSWNFLP